MVMHAEVGMLTVEMPWCAQCWSADISRVSMTMLLFPSAATLKMAYLPLRRLHTSSVIAGRLGRFWVSFATISTPSAMENTCIPTRLMACLSMARSINMLVAPTTDRKTNVATTEMG